jgi:hypothetical protein
MLLYGDIFAGRTHYFLRLSWGYVKAYCLQPLLKDSLCAHGLYRKSLKVENTALFTIEAFVFGYELEGTHRHLIHIFCTGILQAMFPETKRRSILQDQGTKPAYLVSRTRRG